jgi:Replication protein
MIRPQKEENPKELSSLAAEVQRGFDETGKLPERLKRYAFARERALINLAQIDIRINQSSESPFQNHLVKLRSRVAICGDYLGFKNYYTVGKVRLTAANFCMVPLLCPLCAIRRGSKLLDGYVKRLQIIQSDTSGLKLSMLTLTVKNGQDLQERFNHLKKSVSTMLERRRKALSGARGWHSEFAKIAGLVGTYEVTKDGAIDGTESGWHPHVHMMVLHAERFDYTELQAEWLKITGDSHVLNVAPSQHPEDPAQDFLEVFKYALKFSDLTPEQNMHAYEILRGKRLVFSAGLFWGVEIPESMLDEDLDSLPYFELIYNYIAGSGYNLAQPVKGQPEAAAKRAQRV